MFDFLEFYLKVYSKSQFLFYSFQGNDIKDSDNAQFAKFLTVRTEIHIFFL